MTGALSRHVFPAAPPPVDAATTANAGNMFIGWLGLADADGGLVAHYKLVLDADPFSWWHQCVAGVAEICYGVSISVGAIAAAVMDWILNASKWLGPLGDLYTKTTGVLYSAVPPQYVVLAAFAILVLIVFARRPANGPRAKIGKAQWHRLGAGLAIMGLVDFFASNPFRLVNEPLNVITTLASALNFSSQRGGAGQVVNTSSVDMLRSMTFLINYHDVLAPDCARAWSKGINLAAANPSCLTAAQAHAVDPDWQTLVAVGGFVLIVAAFAYFVVIVARLLFNEVSLAIAYVVAGTYIASVSLGRRRPYDPLARCAARFGAHAVMFCLFLFIAAAAPTLLIELPRGITVLPLLFQLLLTSVGYYLVADVLRTIAKNRESLYSLFKGRIEASHHWKALYPGGSPTAAETVVAGTLDNTKSWIRDRHQQWVADPFNRLMHGRPESTARSEGTSMTTGIPDTDQSRAATERVNLYEPPTAEPTILAAHDVDAVDELGQLLTHTTTDTQPAATVVAAAGGGDNIVAARPAGPFTTLEVSPDTRGQLPPVWFRAGIPQFAPPQSLPQLAGASAATTWSVGAAPTSPPANQFPDRIALHATEVGAVIDRTSELDAATEATATYFGYTPTAPDPTALREPSPPQPPRDIRTILASAQWLQRLMHSRNLHQARGVEAPLILSDAEEAVPRIMFVTDRNGHNHVEPNIDSGFGDDI